MQVCVCALVRARGSAAHELSHSLRCRLCACSLRRPCSERVAQSRGLREAWVASARSLLLRAHPEQAKSFLELVECAAISCGAPRRAAHDGPAGRRAGGRAGGRLDS
jgi:hypothetical protein